MGGLICWHYWEVGRTAVGPGWRKRVPWAVSCLTSFFTLFSCFLAHHMNYFVLLYNPWDNGPTPLKLQDKNHLRSLSVSVFCHKISLQISLTHLPSRKASIKSAIRISSTVPSRHWQRKMPVSIWFPSSAAWCGVRWTLKGCRGPTQFDNGCPFLHSSNLSVSQSSHN